MVLVPQVGISVYDWDKSSIIRLPSITKGELNRRARECRQNSDQKTVARVRKVADGFESDRTIGAESVVGIRETPESGNRCERGTRPATGWCLAPGMGTDMREALRVGMHGATAAGRHRDYVHHDLSLEDTKS